MSSIEISLHSTRGKVENASLQPTTTLLSSPNIIEGDITAIDSNIQSSVRSLTSKDVKEELKQVDLEDLLADIPSVPKTIRDLPTELKEKILLHTGSSSFEFFAKEVRYRQSFNAIVFVHYGRMIYRERVIQARKDILFLVRVQGVSKQFRDTIIGSIKLQRSMRMMTYRNITKCVSNPVFFDDPDSYTGDLLPDIARALVHIVRQKLQPDVCSTVYLSDRMRALVREEASWLKMSLSFGGLPSR